MLKRSAVSGPVLKSKSEELARKLGDNNYRATGGWLSVKMQVWDKIQGPWRGQC
jgi:hypothetical protein